LSRRAHESPPPCRSQPGLPPDPNQCEFFVTVAPRVLQMSLIFCYHCGTLYQSFTGKAFRARGLLHTLGCLTPSQHSTQPRPPHPKTSRPFVFNALRTLLRKPNSASLVFNTLRTLRNFKNRIYPLFSCAPALFAKNTGGWGSSVFSEFPKSGRHAQVPLVPSAKAARCDLLLFWDPPILTAANDR
jgi:hypothetical protein